MGRLWNGGPISGGSYELYGLIVSLNDDNVLVESTIDDHRLSIVNG